MCQRLDNNHPSHRTGKRANRQTNKPAKMVARRPMSPTRPLERSLNRAARAHSAACGARRAREARRAGSIKCESVFVRASLTGWPASRAAAHLSAAEAPKWRCLAVPE